MSGRRTASVRVGHGSRWTGPWRLEHWYSGSVWTRDYSADGIEWCFTVVDLPKKAGGR